jgi:hypothetical protein
MKTEKLHSVQDSTKSHSSLGKTKLLPALRDNDNCPL